jgi:hypothetical protein
MLGNIKSGLRLLAVAHFTQTSAAAQYEGNRSRDQQLISIYSIDLLVDYTKRVLR